MRKNKKTGFKTMLRLVRIYRCILCLTYQHISFAINCATINDKLIEEEPMKNINNNIVYY